jgi:hypothetical protein
MAPSLVSLRIAAGAQSPLRARYCDAPDERDVLSNEVQAVIYTDGSIPELHPMATGTPLLLQAPRQCSGDGGVGCDLTVVFAGGQVCPVQVVP